ncbi:MAG: pirin [Alphaproteobacteria bacterium]|nr:pirin [Alphaproteobacteria bacterium]
MRRRSVPLRAWVTPEEKAEVLALAKQAHLTTSELVRRLVTGRQLPSSQRHEDVLNLLKVNADLARLGNLLRMAMTDEELQPPEGMDLEALFDKIRDTQSLLKGKIEDL